MTNLGFHRAMAAAGIEVVTTPVGDRNVLDVLEQRPLRSERQRDPKNATGAWR